MTTTDARRCRAARIVLALALLAASVSSRPSRAEPVLPGTADETSAREFFRAGEAAYARAEYRAAAFAFEEAYRRARSGATLYNAALAWEAAGDKPRAADAFTEALRVGGLAADPASDARRRLARLEPQLGTLRIVEPVGANVRVAHVDAVAVPATIHVLPGEHLVRLREGDGPEQVRSVTALSGATVAVAFAPSPRPAPIPVATAATAPTAKTPAALPKRSAPTASPLRTVGWVGLGVSGALVATSLYIGLRGVHARDQFAEGGATDASLRDEALTLRTWANVAWVSAAVVGVASLAVLVVAPKGAPPPRDAPHALLEF